MRKLWVAAIVSAAVMTSAGPAMAAEPSWGYERVLSCDGQVVRAHVTPGGPFTSFHVVDSNDVIVPKRLEIYGYFEAGSWATTLHVPGFDANKVETVQCTYTDQRGFPIRFDGLRR